MTEKIAATHEEAAKIEELMKAPFPVTLATVAKALNKTFPKIGTIGIYVVCRAAAAGRR